MTSSPAPRPQPQPATDPSTTEAAPDDICPDCGDRADQHSEPAWSNDSPEAPCRGCPDGICRWTW